MYLYTDYACVAHETPEGHPERGDRLRAVLQRLEDTGFSEDHPLRTPTPASAAAILRAHSRSHVDFLQQLETDTLVPVDPDTWLGPHSLQAAHAAAGAVCDGVAALLNGETQRVFCAVRPPGHHAEHATAMGFCLLNSVAIGALEAMTHPTIERVAILDFDVHHGNGTVDIFKDNPAVLVCSSFQHPHYPNRLFDIDRDHIVNTPLPAGTGSEHFRRSIEADWVPALEAHAPQLILVSAGFDAHRADPLADLNLDENDYAWITRLIVEAAASTAAGRVLSTLEGGYDLHALAASVEAHLIQLA